MLAEDVSIPIESDVNATVTNSDLLPLEPPLPAVDILSVLDQRFTSITMRTMKPADRNTSGRTRKKLASGGGKINLMLPLASSSSATPASSSKRRSPLVCLLKGARRYFRSSSPALLLGRSGR